MSSVYVIQPDQIEYLCQTNGVAHIFTGNYAVQVEVDRQTSNGDGWYNVKLSVDEPFRTRTKHPIYTGGKLKVDLGANGFTAVPIYSEKETEE